jgi:aspartate racemase
MPVSNLKQKKTIGILGGMGPEATVHLFELIVKKTRAEKDSAHIPIIIYNNPGIPDRTAAIIGEGESPLPYLINTAKILEQAGADFIAMPCVTAHHYYPEIQKNINIRFIHMIWETVDYITSGLTELKRFGLLATSGTLETGLFQTEMEKKKIRVITPAPGEQKQVMEAIYGPQGIKAGFKDEPRKKLSIIANHLKEKGAAAIIAGCTEIALVIEKIDTDIPTINPLDILASVCIRTAGYQEKPEVENIRI